jgi:Tfp pilus assembly protein PilW
MKLLITKRATKGFTLLEVILYISLAVFALFATSILFSLVLEAKLKQEAIAEVEEQGSLVLRIVTQTIRNANGLNNLSPGNSNTNNLSLITPSTDTNPTIFNLVNGALESTIGLKETTRLTSPYVAMSDLRFQNLGQNNTTGTVRIQFTLTTTNAQKGYQYAYQQTFYGSATIR